MCTQHVHIASVNHIGSTDGDRLSRHPAPANHYSDTLLSRLHYRSHRCNIARFYCAWHTVYAFALYYVVCTGNIAWWCLCITRLLSQAAIVLYTVCKWHIKRQKINTRDNSDAILSTIVTAAMFEVLHTVLQRTHASKVSRLELHSSFSHHRLQKYVIRKTK